MRISNFSWAMAGLLILISSNSLAADDDFQHWSINVGTFLTNWDTSAKLNASGGGQGSDINFEDLLGLEADTNVFRLDTAYRFNEKHRLDFTYFRIDRNSSAMTSMDINWGDQFFPAGSTVSANVDIDFFRLAYTYSLWHGEWGFFGVTGGLHYGNIKTSLDTPGSTIGQSASLNAPLPVVGFLGEWNFHDKWSAKYGMQIFKISIDSIDGSMYDSYAAVDYQLFKKAAIGLGYNWIKINVDSSRSSWNGSLDWEYGGPVAYINFKF